MKAADATFNQEKALVGVVGAFSVITQLRGGSFASLVDTHVLSRVGAPRVLLQFPGPDAPAGSVPGPVPPHP